MTLRLVNKGICQRGSILNNFGSTANLIIGALSLERALNGGHDIVVDNVADFKTCSSRPAIPE